MLGPWIMHCLGMLLAQWSSQRGGGDHVIVVPLHLIIVRAVSVSVARDIGLYSPLPKLRENERDLVIRV